MRIRCEKQKQSLQKKNSSITEESRQVTCAKDLLKRNLQALKTKCEMLSDESNKKIVLPKEDISKLTYFFPNANIAELNKIEMFHTKFSSILEKEIAEEIERVQAEIDETENQIKELEKRQENFGLVTPLSKQCFDSAMSLFSEIASIENALKSYKDKNELKEHILTSKNERKKTKMQFCGKSKTA